MMSCDVIQVVVETKKTTTEAYALKELIIRKGVAMVKEQLAIYIKKLKEGSVVIVTVQYINNAFHLQSLVKGWYCRHKTHQMSLIVNHLKLSHRLNKDKYKQLQSINFVYFITSIGSCG